MLRSLTKNERPWANPLGRSPKMSKWANCSFFRKKLVIYVLRKPMSEFPTLLLSSVQFDVMYRDNSSLFYCIESDYRTRCRDFHKENDCAQCACSVNRPVVFKVNSWRKCFRRKFLWIIIVLLFIDFMRNKHIFDNCITFSVITWDRAMLKIRF